MPKKPVSIGREAVFRAMGLLRVWLDGDNRHGLKTVYQGQDFMKWVMNRFCLILEVFKRSDDVSGFVVLPKRWIVERTYG